jgi:hypothetical protein
MTDSLTPDGGRDELSILSEWLDAGRLRLVICGIRVEDAYGNVIGGAVRGRRPKL